VLPGQPPGQTSANGFRLPEMPFYRPLDSSVFCSLFLIDLRADFFWGLTLQSAIYAGISSVYTDWSFAGAARFYYLR